MMLSSMFSSRLFTLAFDLHVEPTYDEWLRIFAELDGPGSLTMHEGLDWWGYRAPRRECIREALIATAWGLA